MGRGERAAEEDGEWRAVEADEARGGERVWQWRTRRGERVVEDWEGRVEWVVVGDSASFNMLQTTEMVITDKSSQIGDQVIIIL